MTFGKMGARRMMYQWRNPYPAMDSCIAWWDGEWNAGGGKHDISLGKILDLSGCGHDITIPSAWVLGDNYIDSKTTSVKFFFSQAEYDEVISNGLTIEIQTKTVLDSIATLFGWGAYRELSVQWQESYSRIFSAAFIDGGNIVYSTRTTSSRNNHSFVIYTKSGGPSGLYIDGVLSFNMSDRGTFRELAYSGLFPFSTWGDAQNEVISYGCRVHKRIMTASEIAANYAVDKLRFNLT